MALGIHTFIAELRYIPSESMAPTLEVGDHSLVEKLSYRFHPPQRNDLLGCVRFFRVFTNCLL
ncbi:MAG: S26 family signal peptidase [Microcoleus sp. SIO2G3]|nr:S26 family signal peptidase [Microcoleus sp. SIO2G3]